MAYKGFTALFPLVTTTYISRIILPEGVGRVSYANTIVAYFVLVASLGLPSYGVKAIAQNNETKEQRSRTFFELFLINFVATAFCTVAYFLLVNNFPHFAGRRTLFNIMGLMLILNVFNIDWFYQGMEEYAYIATRGFVVKILSFVLMLILVRDAGDYLWYALILCVATAGNNLLNAANLRKYVSLRAAFGKAAGKERMADSGTKAGERCVSGMGQHLRPVMVLLASALATEVYTMLDTIMLEYYHGEICVGYYANPVKIVRMVYTVVIALVAVFYPRISMYYKQQNQEGCNALLEQGTQILLLLALPCTIGLALTADVLIPFLFGEAFLPSINTLRVLSVLVLVFSIAYFLGHTVLTAVGGEHFILRATVAGAVINAVANFMLIPELKQDGAAIASVVSEVVVTGILLWYARKYYAIAIGRRYAGSLAAALLAMTGTVFVMRSVLKENDWTVLVVIAAAAAVYAAVLVVCRNPLAIELIEKVGNRRSAISGRNKG